MADIPNQNGTQKVHTEDKVLQLLQQFRLEETTTEEAVNNEHDLPLEINQFLKNSHLYQFQEYIKKYKRGLSNYFHEQWTVGEIINQELVPKLKKHTVDTHQPNNGNLALVDGQALLRELIDNAKKLATFKLVRHECRGAQISARTLERHEFIERYLPDYCRIANYQQTPYRYGQQSSLIEGTKIYTAFVNNV
ncbi:MAG: hypothetical protein EXX96DRAFT_650173 [Benjaminiella poitrasii]|nr:MAG: hypothetical protein EXX96DRAFT_650173 [Benjaminiella poitrasii]